MTLSTLHSRPMEVAMQTAPDAAHLYPPSGNQIAGIISHRHLWKSFLKEKLERVLTLSDTYVILMEVLRRSADTT